MHAIEDQYTKFVLDALKDPQPVQVVKLCPDCETCGGIDDRLKSIQR